MANIAIFRINYKSDFILTLNSDAGWMTPFCIKFWTGAPSQAYFVGYDGTTYTHCAPVDGDPTKLVVQFDDHHLPIGDLKFQIGYHFTVADFPTTVEDEVINQAAVIIDQDGTPMQVMLDLNGETAPEIEFSLPAYANEAQRIANEEQRIANETQRIGNEETRIQHEESRIAAEQTRQQNEQQRINQEQARVNEFAVLKRESEQATTDANNAAENARQKAQLAQDKATLAQAAAQLCNDKAALAQAAAQIANDKAQLAADKAALAQAASQLCDEKAALAQQKATYAQQQGDYSKAQGDYAKEQGDYSKAQGDYSKEQGDYSKEQGDYAKDKGDICAADHQTAVADHQTATADHQTAAADHQTATTDHNQAGNDHTRAESDHTRAESDHAAVELYVDSIGVFDLSKHNAVGGVLATYADLSAALTALNALDSKYKYGGMSFKFVHTSDNNYVQYRCIADDFTADTKYWSLYRDSIIKDDKKYTFCLVDSKGRIAWAIEFDGNIHYGAGVPKQIKDYIKSKIEELSLDEYEDIVTFLGNLIDGDTLETLLNKKVDGEYVDNNEFIEAHTDKKGRLTYGVKPNNDFYFGGGVPSQIKAELDKGLDTKVDKVQGKGLSTNDFTDAYKSKLDSFDLLPAYYHTDGYIENKYKKINDVWINTAACADIFAFFTDAHYYANNGATDVLLNAILKNTYIKKIFYGGDSASVNTNTDAPVTYEEMIENNNIVSSIYGKCKYFPMKGNHDYYGRTNEAHGSVAVNYPVTATRNIILNQCNVDGIVLNDDEIAPYYYYDEKFSKLRYLVIDAFYTGSAMSFGNYQIPFIVNALLSTPAGHDIVIMCHTNIQSGMVHDDTEFTKLGAIRAIVSAYQNRGTVTIGTTYDFSEAQNHIILFVGAHSHEDMQNYKEGTLYVTVPCSAAYGNVQKSSMFTYHNYPAQTKGTVYEDCFDVMVFDRNNNVLECVRIGCGFNRTFNTNKNTLSVGGTLQLTSKFESVSNWLIHDTDGAVYDNTVAANQEKWTFTNNVASINSSGLVTALSSGECYAIAIASNGDKEFFYISVN